MKSKYYNYFLFAVLLLTSSNLVAQYSPFLENHSLSEYNAGNQNWDVTRADDGKVYVANNSGLLEYDALAWKFYQLPNKTTIRSVLAYKDIVFSGSYEEFGYWKRDNFGTFHYHSLSDSIIEQISPNEEIWEIIRFKDKIIFSSFLNIYVYDFEKITQLKPSSTIISTCVVEDKVFISTLNKGIFSLENKELKQFYFTPLLDNTKIISIKNYKDRLLLLTSLKGSFYLKDERLIATDFPINAEIKQHQLNDFSLLDNGEMVFGTIKDGVFLTDPNGNLKFHISKENGLLNNTILGQYLDTSNNLWLGLDNGISKINLDSHNYFFNDVSGKLGAVYDIIKYKGTTYIGSNTGLFKLDSDNKLEFIEGSQGQVWDLKIIEGELFCGHNEGTFLVDENRFKKISDFTGGWTIQKVPERSQTYIQGTYAGLVKFEKIAGEWKTKYLGKTTIPSRFLVFENPKTAWVAHAYKGLYRIEFDANYDTVTSVKTYDHKGISSNFNVRVYNIKNNISFKTNNGWQKYEPILDSIIPYKLLNEKLGKDSYIISEEHRNALVLKNKAGVISFETFDNSNNHKIFGNNSIKNRYVVGYENVSHISDSIYALNLVNGFMMMNFKFKDELEIFQPVIELITINNEPVDMLAVSDGVITLEYNQSLKIDITSPKSTEHFFEYKISDIKEYWMIMEGKTIELNNLKEGDYTIEVRTRNDFGNVSKINKIQFEMLPPWYRGSSGFLLYIFILILIILVFFFMHKGKIRKEQRLIKVKYQKQQQKLLRKKALENEKHIVQLKNEALLSDIKLKSKQLANNAMALVKKNESLQEIKNELMINKSGFSNYYAYKKLLKKVDNSIVLKDEWEVFEHNFNQVHDEFFEVLKHLHQNLTPKDLKVCAYIKMNLSSKEIAPLMNISARGVETHRYRLKKKLDLDNDTSLVDYLLNMK
jgi:AraC family chitin signaling transcriptional activator